MHAKKTNHRLIALAMAAIATLLLSTIALYTPQTAKASAIGDLCGSDGISHGELVAVSPDICEWVKHSAASTFVVPAGVTSVDVMVIGAGGGGGGRPFIDNYGAHENRIFSGGGGAGEVTICPGLTVTPGETLEAISGVGGVHGNRGNYAGHPGWTKGKDGADGTDSTLKRDTTLLCEATGGKGGKGGDNADVAGFGGESGSGFAGGHASYADLNLGWDHHYASSGGGGAASVGLAAEHDTDWIPGSGGHGISPSTLSPAAAGYFITDTTIYGVGGPGAGFNNAYAEVWGANVDGQIQGYINTYGSGGRGYAGYNGIAMSGEEGVVAFRYLNPVATKSVTITNGGTGSGTVTQGTITKNVGDTFTSVATADAGSVFAGWVCTPNTYDTTNATLTFTVSENVSCVATFNTAPQASTTFSAGAGSGTPPPNVSGPVTMPGLGNMIAPDGSSFGGWNCIWGEGASGTFLEGEVFDPSGNDALCEAFWVSDEGPSAGPVTPPHTVTFDPNGGIGPRIGIGSNSPGKLRLNTFTKPDAIFDGWNTQANGSGIDYADGAFYDYGSDITLYAQWINTYVPPVVKIKLKKLITTFAGDKPTLTPKMLKTITKWVKKLPTGAEIVCQGSTSNSKITKFDKWLANKRATNVCKYARSQRKDISFSITLNPSSANKVAARHVWMFYNY